MCMKPPLVSIVIPVYKVEPYIRQALDSVINQTHKNLQIVLVDDGSPDSCGTICDEYAQKDGRVVVIHKENGGVSSARNAGMDAATGEWLYFMDADDWIEPDTVRLALACAEKTGADMVFFAFDYVEGARHYRRATLNHTDGTKEKFWNNLADVQTFLTFNSGSVCTCLIRFERIQGRVRFDPLINAFEDAMFRTGCYVHIRSFAYIPNVCYHYRYRPGSATNGGIDPEKYMSDSRARCERLKGYAYFFPEKERLLAYACTEYLGTISRMSRSIIPAKSFSAVQKRQYIRQAIDSPYTVECLQHYDKAFARGMVRVSMMFGKPTVGSIYFAYYLRKLYKRFSFIK